MTQAASITKQQLDEIRAECDRHLYHALWELGLGQLTGWDPDELDEYEELLDKSVEGVVGYGWTPIVAARLTAAHRAGLSGHKALSFAGEV